MLRWLERATLRGGIVLSLAENSVVRGNDITEVGRTAYPAGFVRPGTDYAMNLAVLHVLISEKLYDPHMLPYIDGFGELEERVRPCTPEWAETETGIKNNVINTQLVESPDFL